ncbi:transposase [Salmonella enterica]|nr:transposase [Salmonella enterica]EEM7113336.1 hypothetical protein [Salmonella enterica subsp. enterica serovar Poona]EAS9893656.1 transposase [Salmonella enterica]EEG2848752.1 transposase [Salmonella enterica]EEH1295217.1 transposase [Salmonella enterica]
MKAIYQAPTEEAALIALDTFLAIWDDKYPQISKSWRAHWGNMNTLFSYPPDIRKAIYTTNAIESLNSVIRAEDPQFPLSSHGLMIFTPVEQKSFVLRVTTI